MESNETPHRVDAPRRTWLRRAFKRLCYGLYLAVLLELVLQAFYYVGNRTFLFRRTAVPIYRSDEHMGFSVKRDLEFHHVTGEFDTFLHTNHEGFRTSSAHEEYAIPKPAAKFRVMLLGPSFAFGWGVNEEDTFARQLSEKLRDAALAGGREVEVINAGVPAVPPANQLQWYERYGRRFAPDMVIQFIYGSMWVNESPATDSFQVDEQGFLRRSNVSARRKFQEWAKNFATVYYGWVASTALRSKTGSQPSGEVVGAGRALVQQFQFDPAREATRRSVRYYDRLKASVADGNARLVVVHFPLSYVVHRSDISRWSHLGVRNVEDQVRANEEFCAFLRARSVSCVNLTDALAKEAERSPERLYYWLDIHWTPKGNRVAAETVARLLQENSPANKASD